MSKAAQKTGEGKFVLKRSKSEGYDSAHNEYESDSEVNVLASGSGNEYVPQDDGELSRSSKVLLKTHVAQERTGGEQGSSVQSSGDCSGHQINTTSTDDAKCDTATHSTTSSLKSLSKKNSGRFTDNNHNSKNNRNSSSSGRTKLNSSNTFKTAKLDKSKTLKHDKTWMTSTSQDAKVPSIIGGNVATHVPGTTTARKPTFQSRLPSVSGTLRFQTFERVMNLIWKPPSTYTELANIRNRATFSLRHHMLLQEGYLRQSDLVNCFADVHPVPSNSAPQHIVGLGLSMQYGNKVPTAKTEIAMVLRHKDYRRCPVGSLALYLFSRFHVSMIS